MSLGSISNLKVLDVVELKFLKVGGAGDFNICARQAGTTIINIQ